MACCKSVYIHTRKPNRLLQAGFGRANKLCEMKSVCTNARHCARVCTALGEMAGGKQQNYLRDPFCEWTVYPSASPRVSCTHLLPFNFLYRRLQVYVSQAFSLYLSSFVLSEYQITRTRVCIHRQCLSPWENGAPWLREQTGKIRAET